jgi:nitroimidazol reductase NimA-like FMN-containing flavoprotein (pyridoxamine 5'-phosphate oxidase superfamily)
MTMTSLAEKGTPRQPTEEANATQLTHQSASAGQPQRLTLDQVLAELRKQHFAVLSTADDEGTPHSAGVNYGMSAAGARIALYVMTRRHLRKTRNIARNPQVSLVVPVTRRLLSFLPPATIQVHGRAEILDWTDSEGTEVFTGFWVGRRILDAYRESNRRGETRICFLKITPDPIISTYMLGVSVWELRSRMEKGIGKVTIPPDRL